MGLQLLKPERASLSSNVPQGQQGCVVIRGNLQVCQSSNSRGRGVDESSPCYSGALRAHLGRCLGPSRQTLIGGRYSNDHLIINVNVVRSLKFVPGMIGLWVIGRQQVYAVYCAIVIHLLVKYKRQMLLLSQIAN